MSLFFSSLLCLGLLPATMEAAAAPQTTTPIHDTMIPANSSLVIDLTKHLDFPVASPSNTVLVNSSMGNFCIRLFPTNAPATVSNFLDYVTNGYYANMLVHLSVPGTIIETGGYQVNGGSLSTIPTYPAITNEFAIAGLSNVRGTVSMALAGTNPNSATSEWFINLTNNSSKFDATNTASNPPSTVFGEVIGNGMSNVIDKIAALPTDNFTAPPLNFTSEAFTNVPLQNWAKGGTIYLDDLVEIYNIVIPSLVVCSDSNSFSAELQGNNLVVTPIAPNTNPVEITLYAASTNGDAAVLSFHVSQEKLPQNISFPTSYTTYSSSNFSVANYIPNYPSASSGLGVGLTLKSGPVYFSNGQPYLKGPGVVTLLATQPGNFFYSAAPSVVGYVVVDKGNQTINFPSIPDQTNSLFPFTLNLTNFPAASSGLPVTVTVQSGPATLKGKSLAIAGAGAITLIAAQVGNADYYPASTVTNSFVVTNTNTSTNTNTVTNSILFGK